MKNTSGMSDDGILVPKATERAWIEDELRHLVDSAGFAPFVGNPLWNADPEDFPDPWSGDSASLRRLLRRLLRYASAGGEGPDVETWTQAPIELTLYRQADIGAAVAPVGAGSIMWWVGQRGDTLHFAARIEALREPLQIVPAAARAVTEAWRAWRGLTENDDAALEQRRVDLTTVFLGFGRLTTDASLRHGASRTETLRLQRTMSRLGLLSPQAFAYALAIQLRVRSEAARPIVRRLQANPAGFVTASLAQLAPADALRRELGILPPADWPTFASPSTLRAPLADREALPETTATEPDPIVEDRGILGRNQGLPVFRVERSKAWRLARMFGLPVVLLSMLGTRMQMDVQFALVLPVAAGLAVLGLILGRWMPDMRCSDPQCSTPLPITAQTCPRCHGTVVGVIGHPRERLAAEEAWLASKPPSTAPRSTL